MKEVGIDVRPGKENFCAVVVRVMRSDLAQDHATKHIYIKRKIDRYRLLVHQADGFWRWFYTGHWEPKTPPDYPPGPVGPVGPSFDGFGFSCFNNWAPNRKSGFRSYQEAMLAMYEYQNTLSACAHVEIEGYIGNFPSPGPRKRRRK